MEQIVEALTLHLPYLLTTGGMHKMGTSCAARRFSTFSRVRSSSTNRKDKELTTEQVPSTHRILGRVARSNQDSSVVTSDMDTLSATGSDRSELNSPVPWEMALAPTTPLQKVAPAAPTAPAVALCNASGSRGNRA